jgi:uncharacterized protein (TIGR02246 family)
MWLVYASAGQAAGTYADEQAIRITIEQRRVAWNTDDVNTYARLLAEDADILSSTGRSASGREEVIRLYVEQRSGAYRGASITFTVVTHIKFVRPDVAVADAEAELAGLRGADGNAFAPVKGQVVFVLLKQGERWLISSIRGVTRVSVQSVR